MLLPETAACGEMSFKSYKLLQTLKQKQKKKAIISTVLRHSVSSPGLVFYAGTNRKSTQTILKQYDKVSAAPIKCVIKARRSNSTCKTSTKHRKFLSEILKERNTSENMPVGKEGIIVKFALRKDGVRV